MRRIGLVILILSLALPAAATQLSNETLQHHWLNRTTGLSADDIRNFFQSMANSGVLADTGGAATIGILDSAGRYTSTTVEAALAEARTATQTEFIPISDCLDGGAAPAVAAAITGNTRWVARAFDGASNEDVTCVWNVPSDFSGTTVTARVVGFISNATAPAGAIAAQGTITMTGVATANETFVIGGQTYTWKAARAAAGEVTIGASASAAVTNIVAAVTIDGAGVVTAADGDGDTVVVTAVTAGVAGNSIVFTEDSSNMAVDGAGTLGTTTAGVDAEIVAFTVAARCVGNSEAGTGAFGTVQTSSLASDGTIAQHDRYALSFSPAITPGGSIAAGESCALGLVRIASTTDTYAQDFSVTGLEIKYARVLANP